MEARRRVVLSTKKKRSRKITWEKCFIHYYCYTFINYYYHYNTIFFTFVRVHKTKPLVYFFDLSRTIRVDIVFHIILAHFDFMFFTHFHQTRCIPYHFPYVVRSIPPIKKTMFLFIWRCFKHFTGPDFQHYDPVT